MKTKIQIKTVFGKTIYESEKETVKEAIEEYIKQELEKGNSSANLRYVNLYGADLSFTNLSNTDLSNADLNNADLSNVNLRNAYLRYANLSYADLNNVNLSNANLSYANLSYANLRNANLSYVYLSNVNLRNANLSYADLNNADLSNVNLSYANLRNVKHNECTGFLLPQCPSEGSFIAWKKANGKIVKLLVTEDAKRSSSTTLKCRCSKAKVLAIENIDGSDSKLKKIESLYDRKFVYHVGEIVEVKNFDDNKWKECSTGIHFFIAREMAVKY